MGESIINAGDLDGLQNPYSDICYLVVNRLLLRDLFFRINTTRRGDPAPTYLVKANSLPNLSDELRHFFRILALIHEPSRKTFC